MKFQKYVLLIFSFGSHSMPKEEDIAVGGYADEISVFDYDEGTMELYEVNSDNIQEVEESEGLAGNTRNAKIKYEETGSEATCFQVYSVLFMLQAYY